MQFISPICRDKLTINDFDFLCDVLVSKKHHNNFMLKLLEDPQARDTILDNQKIFRAISEWNKSVAISCHLYFYVLVRNTLLKKSIDDRILSDYIAMLLAESIQTYKVYPSESGAAQPIKYIVDLMNNMENSNATQQFYQKADIGNYSLYLTGIFPSFIEKRESSKAAPGIAYYETMGKANFNSLSEHSLAEQHQVDAIYGKLGEGFAEIRLALNEITYNYLHLHKTTEWDRVQTLLSDIEAIDENEDFDEL